ncbi:hypothetical protein PVAND_002499 [Polypedilum vanderplanki]|uniref:FLYWCH-type domain-containing protein n=1 Tax=Polypedilum vanderplanki TaxID=319348 RepID=A0A9J6BRD8_POLVA|nr:hypothetical protein PVAND_002499 [Polypedilum vanderplanki]
MIYFFLDYENIYKYIRLEETRKGGFFVVYDNNKFVHHKSNEGTNVSYYRCVHYQNLKCPARMKVALSDKVCEQLVKHNHLPLIQIDCSTIDVTDDVKKIDTKRGGYSLLIHELEVFNNIYENLQTIPSGKGGTCVLYNDYKFTLHNSNSDGVTYYRCMEHKKQKCHARIKVDVENQLALIFRTHNHPPTPEIDTSLIISEDITEEIEMITNSSGSTVVFHDGFKYLKSGEILIYYEPRQKSTKVAKCLVLEDQTLNLVRGQRGKPLLSWGGFLFAQNNKTADSIYWCCRTKSSRDGKSCKARITTTQQANGLYRINVTQPTHNHEQTSHFASCSEITFVNNQKGGLTLYYEGFSFTKKSSTRDRIYWRCVHQKAFSCKATIVELEEPRRKHYEVEDGITFSMNQKGGMLLIYQGYSYTKKSRSGSSQYWRCIHQKALDCKAGVSQILGSNKFKISCAEHNHPIITTRRKPGEYKALIKAHEITYTTTERGALMLVLKGFPFLKEKTFNNKVSWVCRQKTSLGCKVRLTQDTITNRIIHNDFVHNHEMITQRRKTGCLKKERAQYDYQYELLEDIEQSHCEEIAKEKIEAESGRISFIKSFKNQVQLCLDDFPFTRHRVTGNTVYWRCVQFRSLGCRARLRTQSKRLIVVEPNVAKIRTYDGKPLKISSDLEILKQLKSGHALCHLRRKRVRGYCVKCIKKLGHSIDYKKILEKIFTYCPACEGGPWFCGGLVGHKVEYTMSIKGKLLLMVDSFSFVKQQQKNNNIYWVCKERNTIKCKAKVIQDAKTNKLRARILTHTHQPITVRRKAGELMALRKKHGFKSKIESRKNKSSGNDSK